jgi:DDB1- and CUL4-associated factor 13
LERLFAKPFVGALSGHNDGVYCMAKNPKKISSLVSGSGDGGERITVLVAAVNDLFGLRPA